MVQNYTLSSGKQVKVTAKNKRVAKKFMNAEHYAYTVTVEVDDKMFKTTFHDSIRNYLDGKGATKQMIDTAVYCIVMDYDSYDYNPVLEDFVNEYGYDPEDNKGEKVYKACKATYEALNEMFTREELSELYDLADGDNK